jgi:hypothetical protein
MYLAYNFLKNGEALGRVSLPNSDEILTFLSCFQNAFSTGHKFNLSVIQPLPDVRTTKKSKELSDNIYMSKYLPQIFQWFSVWKEYFIPIKLLSF